MTQRIRNLLVDKISPVRKNRQKLSTLATNIDGSFPKGAFVYEEVVKLEAATLTSIDTGGTGGVISEKLFTPPATYILLLGSFLDLSITSCAAGIVQTGDMLTGIGTTQPADHTAMATTVIDWAALSTKTLVGGAGDDQVFLAAPAYFNCKTTTSIYLSMALADADSTADAAIVFNLTFRFFWIDIGGGL